MIWCCHWCHHASANAHFWCDRLPPSSNCYIQQSTSQAAQCHTMLHHQLDDMVSSFHPRHPRPRYTSPNIWHENFLQYWPIFPAHWMIGQCAMNSTTWLHQRTIIALLWMLDFSAKLSQHYFGSNQLSHNTKPTLSPGLSSSKTTITICHRLHDANWCTPSLLIASCKTIPQSAIMQNIYGPSTA